MKIKKEDMAELLNKIKETLIQENKLQKTDFLENQKILENIINLNFPLKNFYGFLKNFWLLKEKTINFENHFLYYVHRYNNELEKVDFENLIIFDNTSSTKQNKKIKKQIIKKNPSFSSNKEILLKKKEINKKKYFLNERKNNQMSFKNLNEESSTIKKMKKRKDSFFIKISKKCQNLDIGKFSTKNLNSKKDNLCKFLIQQQKKKDQKSKNETVKKSFKKKDIIKKHKSLENITQIKKTILFEKSQQIQPQDDCKNKILQSEISSKKIYNNRIVEKESNLNKNDSPDIFLNNFQIHSSNDELLEEKELQINTLKLEKEIFGDFEKFENKKLSQNKNSSCSDRYRNSVKKSHLPFFIRNYQKSNLLNKDPSKSRFGKNEKKFLKKIKTNEFKLKKNENNFERKHKKTQSLNIEFIKNKLKINSNSLSKKKIEKNNKKKSKKKTNVIKRKDMKKKNFIWDQNFGLKKIEKLRKNKNNKTYKKFSFSTSNFIPKVFFKKD